MDVWKFLTIELVRIWKTTLFIFGKNALQNSKGNKTYLIWKRKTSQQQNNLRWKYDKEVIENLRQENKVLKEENEKLIQENQALKRQIEENKENYCVEEKRMKLANELVKEDCWPGEAR